MLKILIYYSLLFSISTCFAQKSNDTIALYFSNNSHTATLSHINTIDSIIKLEKNFFRKIDVIGYTNNIGSSSYNLELSKKRAQNIASNIHNHNRGKIGWKGELATASSQNRRVDLIIHYEELIEVEKIIDIPNNNDVDTKDNSLSIKISETKIGDKVVLDDILFEGGKDVFLTTSYFTLEELLSYLKQNPSIQFKLEGHICCSPYKDPKIDGINTRTGEQNLSVARAHKVYLYLKSGGIDESRMSYEGFAHLFPQGLENRFLDRRVEIEIISK